MLAQFDLEVINRALINRFGIDTNSTNPMYRVVFSDDQFEKRLTKFTDSGVELMIPEVRLLPKYKQWIKHKYVLENLVVIPEFQREELAGEKLSYEPLFVFENDKGEPLPPKVEVATFIIEQVLAAKANRNPVAKYTEDPEKAIKELEEMEEYLHGNETSVTDALAYGTGVVVPNSYKKD